MALPHPYGRLQFGADLDLHFRTLIGTGCESQRRRRGGDRHRGRLGEEGGRRHRRHRQAGRRLRHRAARRPRHDHAGIARRRRNSCSGRASCAARSARSKDLWVSTKCGESDTTSGCGANPTVGNAFDKLYPHGVTLVFGETTELTGGEHLVAARCRNDEVRKKFQFMFDRYQEVDRPPQDERPLGLAADQGQYRRRPHHHRGEGARQHPEDRPQVHGRRRARQGRDADAARACGSWIRPPPRPRW